MDLFNLEISLKWMNIIKISKKKNYPEKKFNFRIYITWKSMHYWLLQVVYDSINFDSYFISVKGPLKNPEAPFYSLLSLAIKICSLVQMCTIYLQK